MRNILKNELNTDVVEKKALRWFEHVWKMNDEPKGEQEEE